MELLALLICLTIPLVMVAITLFLHHWTHAGTHMHMHWHACTHAVTFTALMHTCARATPARPTFTPFPSLGFEFQLSPSLVSLSLALRSSSHEFSLCSIQPAGEPRGSSHLEGKSAPDTHTPPANVCPARRR